MIPHRPWPLLFLTLALWTGASSAQTWTTVWTPGSAPPPTHTKMEQEMEPEKDHKSPTNCYPCKEWEAYGDGTGKWVLYPRGTTPNRCAGDTTDYTCKECDGKGEVGSKKDGTQELGKAPSGANWKCCGGQPIDPNWYDCCNGKPRHLYTEKCCCDKEVYDPTKQGCCKTENTTPSQLCRLTNNPEEDADPCSSFEPRSSLTVGHVICYNGQPYACTFPQNYPQGWPASVMDTCITRHEETHKSDPRRTKCYKCTTYAAGAPPSNHDASECDAHKEELECAQGYPDDIPGIKEYIESIEIGISKYCR